MKRTFDTDNYLFGILKNAEGLEVTGGIYVMGERPLNSKLEDIVVSTIDLTQDSAPQRGTSNVNIHVPDIDVTIGGIRQKKANRTRLQELTEIVCSLLESANIEGLAIWMTNQNTLKEPDIDQHFVNLRVEWSIH